MSERTDDLPAGWAMATLGEVVSPSKEKIEPAEEPGAAYLSLEHIESHTNQILGHGLSEDVTSTKAVFQKGDVLYGRLRPYLNKVCRPDFGGVCSTDILVFHDSPAVVGEFLLYFLTQRSFVNYATQNAQGINLPRISWDAIADYPFPLPPRPEQERIIKKVATLRSRCRCSSGELNALPSLLENLRQSVLAAAFRGDLTADWRAKNPDVEPATLLLDRIRAECRRKWEKAELVKMQKKGSSPSDEAWKQRYEEPTSIGLTGLPELPQGWCWTTFGEAFGVRVGATPAVRRRHIGAERYLG